MGRVKMRRVSDGLKVIQLSVTDLWLEPGVFPIILIVLPETGLKDGLYASS